MEPASTFVTLISFFRIVLSPHGRGHAAFLLLDPYGNGNAPGKPNVCATDNEPLARYHPDKVTHLGREFQELAHRKLLAIQKAYETLLGKSQ